MCVQSICYSQCDKYINLNTNGDIGRSLLGMLHDVLLQFFGIGPRELVNYALVLDEQESGHAGNVVLGGQIFAFVYIHLDDHKLVCVLVLELLQLGCDHLAWATPCCEKVHQNQLVGGGIQPAVEVSLEIKSGE